jgi:hypothetical protein
MSGGSPDPERDRDRVVRLVGDRHRDPVHPELPGTRLGTTVEPDRGLAGRQPLDLDVAPADAPDAEPEDLADRLLGRPAAGHRLRPVAHVAPLRVGQDPPGEAIAEPLERRADPIDLDDVDPEFGRPRRDRAVRHRGPIRP